MLVGYNYGSEDGEGAWLPVWVGHCEVITRVLVILNKAIHFLVTLWAGQADV